MTKMKFDAACVIETLSQEDRYWFNLEGRGEIYLRKSARELENERRSGLDLASVAVRRPFRRRGVFSSAVAVVEEAAERMNLNYVFVESILNPVLVPILETFQYTIVRRMVGPFLINGQLTTPTEEVHAYKFIHDGAPRSRYTCKVVEPPTGQSKSGV